MEQEIDFRRLHNWLKHFEMRPFGLPVEERGEWQIPDDQRGLHASGHACGTDLLDIVREINPEIIIPVHSEHPSFYAEHLQKYGIRVRLPDVGRPIEV
jgi:ribonuclease J